MSDVIDMIDSATGVTMNGERDILGIWADRSRRAQLPRASLTRLAAV